MYIIRFHFIRHSLNNLNGSTFITVLRRPFIGFCDQSCNLRPGIFLEMKTCHEFRKNSLYEAAESLTRCSRCTEMNLRRPIKRNFSHLLIFTSLLSRRKARPASGYQVNSTSYDQSSQRTRVHKDDVSGCHSSRQFSISRKESFILEYYAFSNIGEGSSRR